eukprot:TRINITY_DN3281_c0_g1_i1.p1 TRINITY_DN3281_c0_g1~~TRINITY_DN3281_c0_g1_i1.p1  ORF type:complete len:658 (+),score=109.35 TRINITY_DN3281_c0_g1_i1:486-2459(+)
MKKGSVIQRNSPLVNISHVTRIKYLPLTSFCFSSALVDQISPENLEHVSLERISESLFSIIGLVDRNKFFSDFLLEVRPILRGFRKLRDKSNIPNLAIAGIGGMGKTEMLYQLYDKYDSHPQKEQNLFLETVNQEILKQDPKHPTLAEAIVAIATFNQSMEFEYQPAHDTENNILARLAARFVASYCKRPVLDCASLFTDKADALSYCAKLLRSRGPCNRNTPPERVALILCVDEVMKITNLSVRSNLLNILASFQQQQLHQGFVTIVVVTSLQLFALEETWVTESKRSMVPLTLTPLQDLDGLKKKCSALKPPHDQDPWALYVRLRIDLCAGHPRKLWDVFSDLQKMGSGPPSWPDGRDDVTSLRACWKVLAHELAGESLEINAEDLASDASWKYLTRHHCVMFETLPLTSKASRFKVKLKSIPYEVIWTGNHFKEPENLPDPGSITTLRNAFTTLNSRAAPWAFESGLVAAFNLLAQACRFVRPQDQVTLGALLPGCWAYNVDPQEWFFEPSPIRKVPRLETKEDFDSLTEGSIHMAEKLTNRAIEGVLKVFDRGATVCRVLVQMKLRGTIRAKDAVEILTKMDLMASEVGLKTYLPVLFCTGDSGQFLTDLEKRLKTTEGFSKALICTTSVCETVLKKFGASALLHFVQENNRQ